MSITLTTTVGPVTLKEMFEGYEAGMDIQRGPFINKTYLAPSWATAFACVNALVGSGGRPVQHSCPESPNLRCMSAVIDPDGEYDIGNSGRPQFNMPKIKCTYAVPTWEALIADDPSGSQSFPDADAPGQPYLFMEQSIKWSRETFPIPKRAYAFADGTVPNTPVNMSIACARFVLVRRWQTTLPYGNVSTYMDSLNDTTFLGQPRGLIKFADAETRKQFQSDGTRSQEVTYTFDWRKYDHNWVPRDDTGAWGLLKNSGGASPHPYTELNAMLR
jgi:hypothetical protein